MQSSSKSGSASSRRTFLVSSALTAAMSRTAAGANDRVRLGVIGGGARGSYMSTVFEAHPDCQVAALSDAYRPTMEQAAAKLKVKPDTYQDYRRIMERKDIDAVLIATPDHWHAPMIIEACQAGKDAYCEKPLSNAIDTAWKAVDAVKQYNRIVQVGLQQRSWDHFQQCAKWVQEGKFGTIFHVGLHWQGSYTRPPEESTAPPDDLDWELFQGPAPRKPYTRSRQRSWRSFYDYGGGIITDQGVHIADVARWYMNAKEPSSVTASAQWVRVPKPDPEQPADSWIITWQYPKFVMSYTNAYIPLVEYDNTQGNFFFGTEGVLHVNRTSYTLKPMPAPPARGGGAPKPAFETLNVAFRYVGGPSDSGHARNFLDCVKSRQKPLTDVEEGFYSTLPLLLGVLAVRYGKMYNWNGKSAVACG